MLWDDNRGFEDLDQAGAGALLQFGKDGVDLFAGLDELDENRQVVADFENVGRMEAVFSAESRDSLDDGCAGNSAMKEKSRTLA